MASKQRQANALEKQIHQAALVAPSHTLTQKDVEVLAPDAPSRLEAINYLLKAGFIKVLRDGKQGISFQAVLKEEFKLKKDMGGEEAMVLSHIQAAGNEGIWTKHLKAKTELHQNVINKHLKSLEQKQLIKAIKSVKHPTRKIYMMFDLEPSVEVTGGPWYTDNELDTEFIKMLKTACLQYIRGRTLPKGTLNVPASQRKLYTLSDAPPYPTAEQVHSFLQKSKITDTELALEHVEMLLNVLVYDRLIERLPALGASLWNTSREQEEAGDEDEEVGSSKRSKKRAKEESSDEDASAETDEETVQPKKKKRKSDSSQQQLQNDRSSKRGSKKRSRTLSDESDESDVDQRRKKRKQQSEVDSADERSTRLGQKEEVLDLGNMQLSAGNVYRALHPIRMSIGVGWTQAPCGRCQQFDFCEGGSGLIAHGLTDLEEGPVNPRNCVYYGDWLQQELAEAT